MTDSATPGPVVDAPPDPLAGVRENSTRDAFPHHVLAGATSATDFFGAGFWGQNSALHLADAGIADVVVVDHDETKLARMADIYPPSWRFWPSDAYLAARVMAEKHMARPPRVADVVVVDPWTQGIDQAWRRMGLWTAICSGRLLLGVHEPWLAERGVAARNARAIDDVLAGMTFTARPKAIPRCVDLHPRSSYVGGVWWAVLEIAE